MVIYQNLLKLFEIIEIKDSYPKKLVYKKLMIVIMATF